MLITICPGRGSNQDLLRANPTLYRVVLYRKAEQVLIIPSTTTIGYLLFSRLMGKQTIWFSNRSDTNRAVQAQKMASGWKFWIYKEEELYYPCSESKALISFFLFAYADCWFSHEAAYLLISRLF